ncbi:MAG TPA: ATP synthase subunit C [Solirubrobacteraceae bacterium]|nr:ATP synthase subunit C [Solirubrobacteraceae bacterium]
MTRSRTVLAVFATGLAVVATGLAVAATGLAGLGATPAGARPPAQVVPGPDPCAQVELALRCPNLVMRRPYALRLVRTPGGRRRLAATNAIVNTGDGPLELRARRVRRGVMEARQVLRAGPGGRTIVVHGTGRVRFYDTRTRGRYWKYEHAAAFELWSLTRAGEPVEPVRAGPKLLYCFRDLRRVHRLDNGRPYPRSPRAEHFGACSQDPSIRRDTLGTSVGWADIHPWRYPQNWIDVTALRGCFLYVMRADPKNHLHETREDDNASGVVVRLPWHGTGRRGCPEATRVPQPGEQAPPPAPAPYAPSQRPAARPPLAPALPAIVRVLRRATPVVCDRSGRRITRPPRGARPPAAAARPRSAAAHRRRRMRTTSTAR